MANDITLKDTGKIRSTDSSATYPQVNGGTAVTIKGAEMIMETAQELQKTPGVNRYGDEEVPTNLAENPMINIIGAIDTYADSSTLKQLMQMWRNPTVKILTDDIFVNNGDGWGYSGIRGEGSSNKFEDASADWQADEWNGFTLQDSANTTFTITDTVAKSGNTSAYLTISGTPATGAYWIYKTSPTQMFVKIEDFRIKKEARHKIPQSATPGSYVEFKMVLRQTR